MKKLHRKISDPVPPKSEFTTIYRPVIKWWDRWIDAIKKAIPIIKSIKKWWDDVRRNK